ncbi:hypothetical protein B0O80DRAFT_445406 [Mortierella sp. GBAus27b]|nr:NTF2- export protein 2 [Mortierella sp. GBA43]KAI8357619.1 hypothetical protein B0O80DRAFT_445406 [Mortierella sp. GBAus27b]
MAEAIRADINLAATGADQFVAVYYKVFDEQRNVLNRLYRDSSAILWNGNAYSGIAPFQAVYEKIPKTVHTVETYDSQPLPTSAQGAPGSIIVNVSGSVLYGDQDRKVFSQSFVLSPDASNGSFYIWSDNFRHV